MAIKNLNRPPQLPIVGKLRKGAPTTGRGPGQELPHFRFTSDDPAVMQAFEQAYGPEPKAIRAVFEHRDVDSVWEAWQEEWGASGLMHRCDGETMTVWRDRQGIMQQTPAPCPHANVLPRTPQMCKPVGRLRIVIPELQRLAAVLVETHSKHDILRIDSILRQMMFMLNGLHGKPFLITRVPTEISRPAQGGARARVTKHLLGIELEPTYVNRMLTATQQHVLAQSVPLLALADDDADEEDDYLIKPA